MPKRPPPHWFFWKTRAPNIFRCDNIRGRIDAAAPPRTGLLFDKSRGARVKKHPHILTHVIKSERRARISARRKSNCPSRAEQRALEHSVAQRAAAAVYHLLTNPGVRCVNPPRRPTRCTYRCTGCARAVHAQCIGQIACSYGVNALIRGTALLHPSGVARTVLRPGPSTTSRRRPRPR